MSYWVSLNEICCQPSESSGMECHGEEWASFNYTSNCAWMWKDAGADLAEWSGLRTNFVLRDLNQAIDHMNRHMGDYARFNPENGWGDALSMTQNFLIPIRDAIYAHGEEPLIIHVSH